MQPNYGRGAHHSFGDFPTDDQVMIIRNAVPIRVPNPEDILLGRGRPYQSHPGNKYMLQLIDSYRDKYQSSERREKHFIITEVLDIIQLRKGRFLVSTCLAYRVFVWFCVRFDYVDSIALLE